ncbi:hypothetical protein [Devosia sp. Root105]|uniref:hypothetical protein n=1 Tax=Devosia sp. Root105 TaxID=1736423 RepID=UPI0006F5627E|nr:hypothetical protein [Devosia sp. Root105]KQV09180.1 hypothetical protein ASC68_02410 [Devosia sp. Root105]
MAESAEEFSRKLARQALLKSLGKQAEPQFSAVRMHSWTIPGLGSGYGFSGIVAITGKDGTHRSVRFMAAPGGAGTEDQMAASDFDTLCDTYCPGAGEPSTF